VLTHMDAAVRLQNYGCTAVMTGRGALIKPWIFKEFREGKAWRPTAEERVGVYMQLVSHMKEHFGADDMGRRKAFYFLPWHFSFFCRYRPFSDDTILQTTMMKPLMTQRQGLTTDGEDASLLSPLEYLLRVQDEGAHEAIAAALWDSDSVEEAITTLCDLAACNLKTWQAADREPSRRNNRSSDYADDATDEEIETHVAG